MNVLAQFGRWLKERRKALDLTQEALAQRVGCATATIKKIEAGSLRPSRQLAELLAAGLEVPIAEQAAFVHWARSAEPEDMALRPHLVAALPHAAPQTVKEEVARSVSGVAERSRPVGGHAVRDHGAEPVLHNPYKGLRAFEEADAIDFFGREALTAQLLTRLSETDARSHFLAVVGPSGSGKSSAVRAGVLPALRRGALPGSDRWRIAALMPGTRPFEEVEAALLRQAVNPPPSLREQMGEDERGLARAVKRVLPDDPAAELMLVIDQFEELFTLVNDAMRRRFLDSLAAAVIDPRGRLRVVITLRADFYDRPLLYPSIGALLRERTEVVLPMTSAELERAIAAPAWRVGVTLEPEAVAALVQDVADQPGTLPLLQYALTELFEQRDGRMLTLRDYRMSGGVREALARRAEEIYAGLDAVEQSATRQLFLRLVTLGDGTDDTRRRLRTAALVSLVHDEPVLEGVLEIFGRYRLLTFDRDPLAGEPTVELAHEALLRSWQRVRDWLEGGRDALRVQRRLAAAAQDWASAGDDPSFLATGVRLAHFEALAADAGAPALNREEHRYLEASLAQREAHRAREEEQAARELELARQAATAARQAAALQQAAATRLRYLAGMLGFVLVAALGLTAFALNRQAAADAARMAAQRSAAAANVARRQAEAAFTRTDALRLAAEANTLLQTRRSPELMALLAMWSMHLQYSPQGDAMLEAASQLAYPRQRYLGHTDAIIGVAFAPDGTAVLTGSWDGTARLWSAASGRHLRSFLGHTAPVLAVAFSPDGRYVLTGSADHTARLWDIHTGRELRRFIGHRAAVNGVAFAPDGRSMLTGSADKTVRLWDIRTGHELRRFIGHTAPVYRVAFAPDGRTVLTASTDKTARLWDVRTGRELRRFIGHTAGVNAVAFAPDGARILTGSDDKTVRLWVTATGREVHVFGGHTSYVTSVAFAPHGTSILTASSDGTARLWDLQTGTLLCAFSSSDKPVVQAVFAPDGKTMLTGNYDATALLWDVQGCPAAAQFPPQAVPVTALAVGPNGTDVATGGWHGTVRLWAAQSGREIRRFPTQDGTVWSVAFGPGGRTVLTSAGPGNTARLWDIRTGREVHVFRGHAGPVIAADLSRDGRYALTGSADRTARLWDVHTGRELRRFVGHTHMVVVVAIAPDGTTALTGSPDGTARLWGTRTGRLLHLLAARTATNAAVNAVAFSPDGRAVLTGNDDATARLWDVATGRQVRVFRGHTGPVDAVAFAPDGKTVLTGSLDATARLWDRASGQEVRRFTGHTDAVNAVAFSPDGTYVFTASMDKTVRIWPASDRRVIDALCGRLTRDISPAERGQYSIEGSGPTCPRATTRSD